MANPGGRLSATDPIEAFVVEPFAFLQFEKRNKIISSIFNSLYSEISWRDIT